MAGMGGRFSSVVSVMVAAILLAACGGGSDDTGTTAGNEPDGRVIEMLKAMPTDQIEFFMYQDVAALLADSDFSQYAWTEGETLDAAFRADHVDAIALMMMDSEEGFYPFVALMHGTFSFDAVTSGLPDNAAHREYGGDDLWDVPTEEEFFGMSGNCLGVSKNIGVEAMHEELVKRCLDALSGQQTSLYDDPNVRAVISRLPESLAMVCFVESDDESPEYAGLQVTAMSGAKKDAVTIAMSAVAKFESAESARNAVSEMEAEILSEDDIRNVRVDQDGEFIHISGEMDPAEFLSFGLSDDD